jgi:hypothetical protein
MQPDNSMPSPSIARVILATRVILRSVPVCLSRKPGNVLQGHIILRDGRLPRHFEMVNVYPIRFAPVYNMRHPPARLVQGRKRSVHH